MSGNARWWGEEGRLFRFSGWKWRVRYVFYFSNSSGTGNSACLGRLEAVGGRGWAGRRSELRGGKTGSGGVGGVGYSSGWASKVE